LKRISRNHIIFLGMAVLSCIYTPILMGQDSDVPAADTNVQSNDQKAVDANAAKDQSPPADVADPLLSAEEIIALEGEASKLVQKIVNEIISKHIPTEQFSFTSAVKFVDTVKSSIPYMPTPSVTTEAGLNLHADSIESVAIKVYLSNKFAKDTYDSLSTIIKERLSSFSAKTSIKFEMLKIAMPKDDLEKKIDSQTVELKTLEQSRDEIKTELERTKTTFEEMLREEQQKSVESQKIAQEIEEKDELTKFLINAAIVLFVAIVLGGILVISSKIFSKAITAVGAGIGSIAGALENMSAAKSTGEAESPDTSADKDPVGTTYNSEGGQSSTTSTDFESLKIQLEDLNTQLLATIDADNESIVMRYITQLLDSPSTVANAVVTMEVLGSEKANEFFHRLSRPRQEKIIEFLNHGHYGKNKMQMMVEAGEELVTKLMGARFGVARGKQLADIQEKIINMSSIDIAEALSQLTPQLRSRLFVYLDASKVAEVISAFAKSYPADVNDLLSQIHEIGEVDTNTELDDELRPVLDSILQAKKEDNKEPYLRYYQEIVETLDEDLAEQLMEKLSTSDERLAAHLQDTIITFKTFFSLNLELQKEVLDGFGNKAVASLIWGSDDDAKQLYLDCVAERRHDLITEELETFEALSKREVNADFDKVKGVVVAKIRHLKKIGALEDLGKKSDSNSESNNEQAA